MNDPASENNMANHRESYAGPERRKYLDIGSRILELEINYRNLNDLNAHHIKEIRDQLKEIFNIIKGDGIQATGIVHKLEKIVTCEEQLKVMRQTENSRFRLIIWAIGILGLFSATQIVVLFRLIILGI